MLLLLMFGCTDDIDAGKLAGTTVTEAWIDDFAWGSFTVVGGVLGGEGLLKATTTDGELVRQRIGFFGGVGGFGIVTMLASGGRVDYQLPQAEVPGEALFGAFDGSLEAIVVGGGYQSMHLRSADGVELDSEGFGAIMAIGVLAVSIDLYAVQQQAAQPGDTGLYWDSGSDSAPLGESGPADSGETGESGPADSGETGESGPADSGETGESGPADSGETGDSG